MDRTPRTTSRRPGPLPGSVPLALTTTVLLGTGVLVREGTRAALQVHAMKAAGRRVPRLELDLDLPGTDPLRRVVVLGDSSAAGHGLPDAELTVARRVARTLVELDGRRTALVVAAEDGADLRCVRDHQLEHARDAEVVLLGVGANDAIRRHTPVRVAREQAELFDRIRELAAPGAVIVLVSAPDLSAAPALPPILRPVLGWWCRATAWAQGAIADEYDVPVVALPRETLSPELFGDDGFHPGPVGHERTAAAVVDHLSPA